MSTLDQRRRDAMRALPALPRALIYLHNFYGVDIDAMVMGLSTDSGTVALALANARRTIHEFPFANSDSCAHDDTRLPLSQLERRLRLEYREWLEGTFAESGYASTVSWPDPATAIEADEEAAASFIISHLPGRLQRAVARSRKPNVPTIDLWKFTLPWRRILRRRLLDVTGDLRCSGWCPFDEWMAKRVAPDRPYPHLTDDPQRRRRPLPDETAVRWSLDNYEIRWPEHQQGRLEALSRLTQDTHNLFHYYGRNTHEIARLLGIGRHNVSRRIYRALYAASGWQRPSLAWSIHFAVRMRWAHRIEQLREAWAAMRD